MGKNVLVISGSPRKGGNSDTLCDQFIQGAREAGHIIEKVYLRDSTIEYCRACYACRETKKCVHNDDMDAILDKMIAADAIVLSTPVYFYAMAGQVKTMIDRTLPRYTEITDKDFYIILTAAVENRQAVQRTIEEFRGFFDCLDGAVEREIVYGTGAWKIGDIQSNTAMEVAHHAGAAV